MTLPLTEEEIKERNKQQIAQALGNTNRYYFWLKHGREAYDDEELILYYIDDGGAKSFSLEEKARREREAISYK